MLVADECEDLVLHDRAAKSSTKLVAVKLGIFHVCGDVGVLLEEEWSSVQPVCCSAAIERSVKQVCTGRCIHLDVRAGGRTLLGIVHGRIDVDLLEELWRRRRDSIAD